VSAPSLTPDTPETMQRLIVALTARVEDQDERIAELTAVVVELDRLWSEDNTTPQDIHWAPETHALWKAARAAIGNGEAHNAA
jgi:hypothetical protein